MKKQSLAIFAIVITGFIIGGIAYAQTIITDTSITTPNLTVTGTCTGCGGSGSFTSYNTMLMNVTTTNADIHFEKVSISNVGSVLITGNSFNQLVNSGGTTISSTGNTAGSSIDPSQTSQSVDGKYQVIIDSTANKVNVYKNQIFLQSLGINLSQFSGSVINQNGIAISPDGHYIVLVGQDSAANDRVLVFQGS